MCLTCIHTEDILCSHPLFSISTYFACRLEHNPITTDKQSIGCNLLKETTTRAWLIKHFRLVFARISHDPQCSSISITKTHATYTGHLEALLHYCLSSLLSWPQTQVYSGLFLFRLRVGFLLLCCCCLSALPPFVHWPLLYFLFVLCASGHPEGSSKFSNFESLSVLLGRIVICVYAHSSWIVTYWVLYSYDMTYTQSNSNKLPFNFPCHGGLIIYQFMKIQSGGVHLSLIAEQSVSSTSDLLSQEKPLYSLTGNNPPMWLLLICANDIDLFRMYQFVCTSLLCFLHAK